LNDQKDNVVEMFFFARFHARLGNEQAVEDALLDVLAPSRQESGCLSIDAFRSIHDPRLFYIHSRWKDEAAFDVHAGLPHTAEFIERVEPLIDHPLDLTRAKKLNERSRHDGDRLERAGGDHRGGGRHHWHRETSQ
jgi:quinol monooxygenase YgiN